MTDRFAPADKCAIIRVHTSDPDQLPPLELAAERRGAVTVDRTLRQLEATFSQPLAALRFGVYARGTGSPLRIGLHFGRPLASGRTDAARGPAARIVRRLTRLARAGQLLMTDAFFSQLASAGRTAFDTQCRELGTYQLRPGGRPYRIHILAPDGEATEPPPALGETNIDREASAFFGREALLEQLGRKLERHRIVTMTGPPGIGKSRTARQYLRRHRTDQPGADSWLVDLVHCESLRDVVDAIASTIGISLAGTEEADPLLTIGRALAARSESTIALDGADDISPQVAVSLQTLLPMAPSARWLVTSRRPLNLVPEYELEVGGLSADDATLLFQDRLDRAGRPFTLDETNLEPVLDLVHAVGGSPLAVELIAHRCLARRPQEVARDIGDDPAAGTLPDLVDDLIDRLDETDRELLAACTIAPAPFPVAIARRFGARLSALRSQGLVCIVPSTGPDDTLNVDVPRPIAEALADRSGVTDDQVDRWLSLFADWLVADQGPPPWKRTAPLLDRLERQRHNLTFAAERGLEEGHDRAALLLLALYTLVQGRGPLTVAERLIERALDREDDVFEARERVELQLALSHLRTLAGDLEGGFEVASAADEALDADEEPTLAVLARSARAFARIAAGGAADGDPYARAAAIADDATPHTRAYVGMYRARHRLERGDLSETDRHLRAAFDQLEADNSQLAAHLDRIAGERAAADFRFREADDHLRRALGLFRRLGYEREAGSTLRLLGRTSYDAGDADGAASYFWEALSIARRAGHPPEAVMSLGNLAGLAFERQAFGTTRDRLQEAIAGADAIDMPVVAGLLRAMLAATRATLGRVDRAERQLVSLREQLRELDVDHWRPPFDLVSRIPEIARVEFGMVDPDALRDIQRWLLESMSERIEFDNLGERDALRCLESYLTFVEHGGRHRARSVDRPRRPTLLIGPNGNWFRLAEGEPVDLSRRGPPRLIFDRLARHRLAFPARPLSIAALGRVGWPGASLDEETRQNRVYSAIGTLRELGLRRALVTHQGGYLISPEFAVRFARR